MPSWTTPPPHAPKRCREDVEADVRVLMSKHAAIGDRGFDSAAQRKILRDRIDRYLDEHSLLVSLEAFTETS